VKGDRRASRRSDECLSKARRSQLQSRYIDILHDIVRDGHREVAYIDTYAVSPICSVVVLHVLCRNLLKQRTHVLYSLEYRMKNTSDR
jgi:hypothetical protein